MTSLKWVTKLWNFLKNQATEKNIATHMSEESMKVFVLRHAHAKRFS